MAVALLGFGAFLAYSGNNSGAGLTYTTGIICLIFSFLPSFKRFSGLGIKAELLENKIQEADRIIGMMKDISLPISEIVFISLTKIGFLGGPIPKTEQKRLVDSLEDALKRLGVDKSKIAPMKKELHRIHRIHLARPLYELIKIEVGRENNKCHSEMDRINKNPADKNESIFNDLIKKRDKCVSDLNKLSEIAKNRNKDNYLKQLLDFLDQCEGLTDEKKKQIRKASKELIEDVKHYNEYLDFRRPEAWFKNDNWEFESKDRIIL